MDYFYKKILSLLMGEMYHDPMVVFREYVQNACDAIDLAVKNNVIENRNKALVDICLKSDSVIIRDNGMGIAKDEVAKLLLGISSSEKDGIDTIGKYGVGRLTGAKYCKRLVFETSYPGENWVSTVIWDITKYNQLMKDPSIKLASDVIEKCTSCSYEESDVKEQHYFQVILEGANKAILDVENVKNYLSLKVPVDYTDTFKNIIIEPSCESDAEFKTRFEKLKGYKVTVNTINQTFKPFKVEVKNQNDSVKLSRQNFFVVKGYTGEELAWGWYCLPLSIKQINNCPFVGLQVRKHNMVVGYNDFLDQYLGKAKPYIAGELFISSNKIMPSSSRDGFYDSPEVIELFEWLKKYFKKVYSDEIDTLSRFRDVQVEQTLQVLRERAILRKKVEEGAVSQSTSKELNDKCDKKLDEFATYIRSNKLKTKFLKEVSKEIIDYYTQKINESLPDDIDAINLYDEDAKRKEVKKQEIINSNTKETEKGEEEVVDAAKPIENKPVDQDSGGGKTVLIIDANPVQEIEDERDGLDTEPQPTGGTMTCDTPKEGNSSDFLIGVEKSMEIVNQVIEESEDLSPKFKRVLWDEISKQVKEKCNAKFF
jgi:molecular chaperone HtpG